MLYGNPNTYTLYAIEVPDVDIDLSDVDKTHGMPFDRGGADSYYRRGAEPHYWPEGTGNGYRVEECDMTPRQVKEYILGYEYNESLGDHKDWE